MIKMEWEKLLKGGLSMNDEIYSFLELLFDKNELRPKEQFEKRFQNHQCQIQTTYLSNQLVGVIIYYEMKDFILIEYFGIAGNWQSKGLGTKILKEFLLHQDKIILLEVEPATDLLKQKRIEFYQRLGFYLNNEAYTMPSFTNKNEEIPLFVMSYPNKIDPIQFQKFNQEIKKYVYDIEL